jgi:ABC-type glycerol-3-phosphate transport system substrate-binding protein
MGSATVVKSAVEIERAEAMAYVWKWFYGKDNQEFMGKQLAAPPVQRS